MDLRLTFLCHVLFNALNTKINVNYVYTVSNRTIVARSERTNCMMCAVSFVYVRLYRDCGES
jgi:hypothetical protein